MNEQKWDLTRLDNGDLSALRRAAGAPGMDLTALRAFYKACGYCNPQVERYWFPMLCMDALWRTTDHPEIKPMEECLRTLLAGKDDMSESLKHRVDMLLETPWSEDGFLLGKLLNMVKIIRSKTNLKPDFQNLADDIRRWNDSGQSVQRRWVRTVYNVKPEVDEKEEKEHDA